MATDAADALERGRERYAGRAWLEAYEFLVQADSERALSTADLQLLATSAYMVGRESEFLELLERSYQSYLDSDDDRGAARCAFWVALNLARGGESGQASGWMSRARRLLDREEGECVERGYILLPNVFEHEARGDWQAAGAIAAEAQEIGERLGDPDLAALAGHERGHTLIRQGLVREGIARLDETTARCDLLPPFAEIMVAVGELDAAAVACEELEGLARSFGSAALEAAADGARGALELGRDDPQTALAALRQLRGRGGSWTPPMRRPRAGVDRACLPRARR